MVHNAEMLSGLEAAVLNAVDREMLLGDLVSAHRDSKPRRP